MVKRGENKRERDARKDKKRDEGKVRRNRIEGRCTEERVETHNVPRQRLGAQRRAASSIREALGFLLNSEENEELRDIGGRAESHRGFLRFTSFSS